MRRLYCYFFLFSIIILSSCQTGKQPSAPAQKVSIDTAKKDKHKFIEDFTDSLRFVALESKKGYEISRVDKLFATPVNLIVYDLSKHRVLIYNSNGKVLAKIDGYSSHPDGHSVITNVSFDYKKNQIIILDLKQENIINYDLKGQPVATVAIQDGGKAGMGVVKVKDGYIFNRNNRDRDGNRIAFFSSDDKEAKFENSVLPLPESIKNSQYFSDDLLDICNDSLFYFPPLANTIYCLTPTEAVPVYNLDQNGMPLVTKKLTNHQHFSNTFQIYGTGRHMPDIYGTFNLHVTPKLLFFNYSKGLDGAPFSFFYERNKKSSFLVDRRVAFKKYPKNTFVNFVIGKLNDYLILPIYSDTYGDNGFVNQLPAEMGNAIKNNSPILIFYRPKESLLN